MLFSKVIEYEGDNNTFVKKFPSSDFTTGAQLIVHESQEAVFMVDGKLMDVFRAGRYTLETANLPLISSIMKLGTGGRTPFHSELYFINMTEQMAIPWGTDSKVQYVDPVYQFPVQIGACGEMSLAVIHPEKLLVKVVGTENELSQNSLSEKLRSFVMKHVKANLAGYIIQNNWNVFELDQHLPDFSDHIRQILADEFADYGVKPVTFSVMTILTPEEDRNFIRFKDLHYRKVTDVKEAELKQQIDLIEQNTKAQKTLIEANATAQRREIEGYTYREEQEFKVAGKMAENEAVGQIGNLGVGLGVMAGVGSTVGGRVGNMAADAMSGIGNIGSNRGVNGHFCMECGSKLPDNAKFCPICGTKRQ